jgi:hypothetical protein
VNAILAKALERKARGKVINPDADLGAWRRSLENYGRLCERVEAAAGARAVAHG